MNTTQSFTKMWFEEGLGSLLLQMLLVLNHPRVPLFNLFLRGFLRCVENAPNYQQR